MTTPSPHLHAGVAGDEEARRRSLRGAARAMPEAAGLICDTLHLDMICRRAACRRTRRCHGHPRQCLDTTGERVPVAVYEWAVLLAQARQDGESAADIEALYPEEALAWRCWVAGLDACVRRNR